MNCPHCQAQNPRGARFCLNCGSALVQRCPSCQFELPGGAPQSDDITVLVLRRTAQACVDDMINNRLVSGGECDP